MKKVFYCLVTTSKVLHLTKLAYEQVNKFKPVVSELFTLSHMLCMYSVRNIPVLSLS